MIARKSACVFMKYSVQGLILSISVTSAFQVLPRGFDSVHRRLPQVQRVKFPTLSAVNAWATHNTELDHLFFACREATIPAQLDSNEGSHDSSRWEWGTWVNLESLESLMVHFRGLRTSGMLLF